MGLRRRAFALACALASAIAAVALPGGGGGAVAAAGCPGAELFQGRRGEWTVFQGPKFPVGAETISTHAIDISNPKRWYVTNGAVIMASRDGGCTWSESFRLPAAPSADAPYGGPASHITHLSANGGRAVAAISAPKTAVIPDTENVTFVLRSPDSGGTWLRSQDPVALAGKPGPLTFAAHAGHVYAAAASVVYHSQDGGATFAPTAPLGDAASITHLGMHSSLETIVWAKAANGPAFRTENAGASWRRYGDGDGVGAASTFGPTLSDPSGTGERTRVTFFATEPGSGNLTGLIHSDDNGTSFNGVDKASVSGVEGRFESFTSGRERGDVLVTTVDPTGKAHDGVYRWQPDGRRLVNLDEFALGPLRGAQAEAGTQPRFHFHTGNELITYKEPDGGAAAVPLPLPDGRDPEPPDTAPPSLSPGQGDVEVPAGKTRSVRYQLHLPPRSAQLDTFFLLDTSNSTDPYIKGLEQGISRLARGLASAGLDVRFGLGEYQDSVTTNGVRYRRRADIGAAKTLRQALAGMETAGGEEPGYTAIHQAVSGSGIPQPGRGLPVAPGQNASWRKRSLRTLLIVADESFAHDPDGSSREQAITALKEAEVRFVGVMVTDPGLQPLQPGTAPDCPTVLATPGPSQPGALGAVRLRCQLEDIATATNSFAPRGGTDCDGDGKTDVAEGQPLVCELHEDPGAKIVAVADPLRRVLLAVTDAQPVVLSAVGDPEPRVAVKPEGDFKGIDLKKEHRLGFNVEYGCSRAQATKNFPVTLEARVAGREVARATPRILCGALAAVAVPPRKRSEPKERPAKKPAPAPKPPAHVAVVPAPAPPPVPAPASQIVPIPPLAPLPPPAPASAAAIAAQPAGASAPAAAVADRGETAPSVTLVHTDDEQTSPAELSFSNASATSVPADSSWLARLLGITAVLSGAIGLLPAPGPRRRPRPVQVRLQTHPASTTHHNRRRKRRRRP